MTRRAVALLGVGMLVAFGVARAQVVDGKQIVATELISAGWKPNEPVLVGLRFKIEPGWYLYWKNPGDSGLPVAVTWELPAGFTVGELQFPTPQKFDYDNLIAYGYKNELVLLVEVIPPPAFRLTAAATLAANLDWLVCKESCVRGKARVERPLNAAPAAWEIFSRAQARLPRKLSDAGIAVKSASISKSANRLHVVAEFAGEQASAISDFYPDVVADAVIDFQTIEMQNGRLTMSLEPYSVSKQPRELKGLVILNGVGYECVIPLPLP